MNGRPGKKPGVDCVSSLCRLWLGPGSQHCQEAGKRLLEKILYYQPLETEKEQRMLVKFTGVTRATIKGTQSTPRALESHPVYQGAEVLGPKIDLNPKL